MVNLDILHELTGFEHHEFCAITTAAGFMVTGEHMLPGEVAVIVADSGIKYEIRRVA